MRQARLIATMAALTAGLIGAASAEDSVNCIIDHKTKKEEVVKGKIESEAPSGVKIVVKAPGKKELPQTKFIKNEDIVWIVYDDKDVTTLEVRGAFGKEIRGTDNAGTLKFREKSLEDALKAFEDLERKYATSPQGRRDMQFNVARVVLLQARLAEAPAVKEQRMERAIKLLAEFKEKHKYTWQTMRALKFLAQIHEERGESDKARTVYEALVAMPDVSPELRRDSELLVARLILRGGVGNEAPEAEKLLTKLAKELPTTDPRRPYTQTYLIEAAMVQGKEENAEKQLKELIRDNADAKLRGVAYNLLGDHYRKKGKNEEAFWSYLRVDAQYGDDPEEQAKALWYLADLFVREKNDKGRAEACLSKLRGEGFALTRYHRMAKGVKK